LRELHKKYITDPESLDYTFRNLNWVMKTSQVHVLTNMYRLLEGLLLPFAQSSSPLSSEQYERFYLYSFMWSFGGLMEHKKIA